MSKIKSYTIGVGEINFISDSGNNYTINKYSGCSCKGFIFRHRCGHYDEAKRMGLIDQIKNNIFNTSFKFKQSEYIISMRKDAIKKFLKMEIISTPFS